MEHCLVEENTVEKMQRSKKILAEITVKIKLALCLPRLLANDGDLLKKYIPENDLTCILENMKKYSKREKMLEGGGSPGKNVGLNNLLFVIERTRHNQLHFSKGNSDEMFKLCGATLSALEETDVISYCDKHLKDMISDAGATFLTAMQKLNRFPLQEIRPSFKLEESRSANLTTLSSLFIKAQQECAEAQNTYEDCKLEVEHIIQEKQEVINDYRKKLEAIKQNVFEHVRKLIERSEDKIIVGIQSSKQRQRNMLKTLSATEEKLKYLQEFNKCKEGALQEIRGNAETGLLELIGKYDTDMGNKQQELEDLMAQYKKEQIMLVELQKNFKIQNEIFIKLMAEKSEYEQTLWDERLLLVQQKFAARKIQRCVRNYLARLKAKGKKYGGRKKGKKGAKK